MTFTTAELVDRAQQPRAHRPRQPDVAPGEHPQGRLRCRLGVARRGEFPNASPLHASLATAVARSIDLHASHRPYELLDLRNRLPRTEEPPEDLDREQFGDVVRLVPVGDLAVE